MGTAGRQLAILTRNDAPDGEQSQAWQEPLYSRGPDGAARGLAAYLERQPAWLVLGMGGVLTALVTLVDLPAGRGLYLTPIYMVPVGLVSWLLGRRAGLAMAATGALIWSLAYVLGGPALAWGTVAPYWNIASQLGMLLAVGLVVSGLREALEREKELARTDPLTGVPNSRAFLEHLDRELSRALRYKHPFTVAYLDTDDFKVINDHFGHNEGDRLLRAIADTVGANMRATDLVARMAGDEFTLLLPETGRKESEIVMARVKHALAIAMQSYGWPVTFSMGVVTYDSPPPSVHDLIKVADDLMYSVKRGGKNSVQHAVYEEREGSAA
jgi:diguanylate cyclase (GGDEF)-like protein